MIPDTITLLFDPFSDEATARVFHDDLARTFYLAWRPGHIISQYFPFACLQVADSIRRRQPKTVYELKACILPNQYDLSRSDINAFVPDFLPFILGDRSIGYIVEAAEAAGEKHETRR